MSSVFVTNSTIFCGLFFSRRCFWPRLLCVFSSSASFSTSFDFVYFAMCPSFFYRWNTKDFFFPSRVIWLLEKKIHSCLNRILLLDSTDQTRLVMADFSLKKSHMERSSIMSYVKLILTERLDTGGKEKWKTRIRWPLLLSCCVHVASIDRSVHKPSRLVRTWTGHGVEMVHLFGWIYYTLVQPWRRKKDLCNLHFRPMLFFPKMAAVVKIIKLQIYFECGSMSQQTTDEI